MNSNQLYVEPITPELRMWWDKIILECTRLHHELHKSGLHVTAHKMHDVVKQIGWEVAGQIEKRGYSTDDMDN